MRTDIVEIAKDDAGLVPLTLRVNGEEHHVKVAVHHTLLELLRNHLKLFGVREGCGVGMCGACTVLLDGKAISSCLMLAPMAQGREVLTIEGLGEDRHGGVLDTIQQAYVDHTAFQCSYCTPGFVLMTKALLEESERLSEPEIKTYLGGNLCRCGSYLKIIDAVMDVERRRRSNPDEGSNLHGPSQEGSSA